MSRKDSDPWVRTFSVTDPVRHPKGYTLYKVTSKVFPKNSIEAVTQVTVWKRYNDFKKLHKSLHALHQGLYLKGSFPPFAKARFFGRFDDEVVEERRKCALELLEFAAKYPPLFTSQIFVKFFESGQVIENPPLHENEENCSDPVLQPTNLNTSSASSNISFQKDEKENGNSLGGIWRHRQPADEISISSQNATDVEDEEDDRTTFTDDDPPAGKLSLDLSEFDPILENSTLEGTPKSSRGGTLCNEWLISAFHSCNVNDSERKDSDDLLEFPTPFGNIEDLDPKPASTEKLGSKSNGSLSDCDISPINFKDFDPYHSSPIKNHPQPSSKENVLPACDDKAPSSEVSDLSYILHSAKLVSAAQNAETAGNVFEAFTLYKTAVDTLLQGVKEDKCPEQSEAVRRKVLQYLRRAEELYEDYLISGKQKETSNSCSQNYSSNISLGKTMDLQLRKPITDLGKYRVIGVLPGVILVVNTVSNNTCVVKVLRKSPSPLKPDVPNIAPRSIRFMVDLYEVYETEDVIFLILEYASGGRLWDYLSSYLQQSPALLSNDHEGAFLLEPMHKSSLTNVYSAKKLEAKKPVDLPITKNLSEPIVTIGAAASDDPDLTPATDCPPSYVALFKNYLVTTVSKKDAGLAHCKIDDPSVQNDNGDKKPINSPFSVGSDISDLKYIDETESQLNEKKESSSSPVDTDAHSDLQSAHSKNNADLFVYYRNVMDRINSSARDLSKNDFVQNSSCLDSGKRNAEDGSPSSKVEDASKTASPKLLKNSKDLKVFFHRGTEKSDSEKDRKFVGLFASEDEKSNTLVHLSSSTGTLDCNAAGQPGLTEMFQEMYTEILASKPGPLPESSIAKWGAEIVTVLHSLHKLGIIWQDLNPENILLGSEGHVLLTYQSQWNCVDHLLNEEAKKNLYSAPEVGRVFPVTPACDWWSLGAILFELLTGKKLVSCHPSGITSHTTLSISDFLSPEAEDILKQLLRYNESERLGSGPHGAEDIKYHPFFHSVDWDTLDIC